MGIIAFLILGGLAGWLASIVMGTNESQGILTNVIVGVIGALIGGILFNLMGTGGVTGFNFWSLFVATVGAILLIWILKVARG